MEKSGRTIFDTKILIGIFIIILGGALLMENMGYYLDFNIWDFWPAILIFVGIGQVMQPRETRQSLTGALLIFVGSVILLNNLDVVDLNFSDIWPFILIMIGFLILRHSFGKHNYDPSSSDYINLALILGGGDNSFITDNFKGGKITDIMGGGTVDLREAKIKEDVIEIETFAFWGGIEIRVPHNWHVNMKGIPFMGAMENKTSTSDLQKNGSDLPQKGKRVIITGMAIMGGVEIKN